MTTPYELKKSLDQLLEIVAVMTSYRLLNIK